MALSANIGGWIADTLVSKGLSVTTVRKVQLLKKFYQKRYFAYYFEYHIVTELMFFPFLCDLLAA